MWVDELPEGLACSADNEGSVIFWARWEDEQVVERAERGIRTFCQKALVDEGGDDMCVFQVAVIARVSERKRKNGDYIHTD